MTDRATRLGLEPGSAPVSQLEPGIFANEGQAGVIGQDDALASIAISLKRIADSLQTLAISGWTRTDRP